MISRTAILLTLALTILGSLGGLFGALIQPARYQAEAFVVVYEMPSGFNNLISPDEANTINAYYAAGALQDSVIQRVRYRFSSLTATEIRQAIQISIVAYTPLTRVTATAASPQVAVTLANAVANAWVDDAGAVITNAYNSTYSSLLDHEQQLNDQIKATRAALEAPKLSKAKAQALTAQLNSLENAYASTDANLTALVKQRYAVAGNTYVATQATESTVTRVPSISKSFITGGALGLACGVVCMLWMIRAAQRAPTQRALPAPLPTPSAARGTRTTTPIQWEPYDS